jgi:hypothetical protein
MGWAWCEKMGSMFTANFDLPEIASRFWRKLVALQQMIGLRKSTTTSWAEQKIPTKCHCTFVYHSVTLSMKMGQNLWWLKTLSYENMCVTVMLASKLQVLDVVVNKPFQDHIKQLYNMCGSWQGIMFWPRRIMKHTVWLLFVSGSQQHGRSDFEEFQKVPYILCNGMTMKKMVMFAVNVRRLRHWLWWNSGTDW